MGKPRGASRRVVSCERACPVCKSVDLERQGASRAPAGSWEDPKISFWLMKCRGCGHLFEYREFSER